jgi:hypothetical protein
VGFGAGFFFRVVFFILFAGALRFAFLDFFAMFNLPTVLKPGHHTRPLILL